MNALPNPFRSAPGLPRGLRILVQIVGAAVVGALLALLFGHWLAAASCLPLILALWALDRGRTWGAFALLGSAAVLFVLAAFEALHWGAAGAASIGLLAVAAVVPVLLRFDALATALWGLICVSPAGLVAAHLIWSSPPAATPRSRACAPAAEAVMSRSEPPPAIVRRELAAWQRGDEPAVAEEIRAPQMRVEGSWVKGVKHRTMLVARRLPSGRYRVEFVTSGCEGSWRLERQGTFDEGVLLLDRPVKEYDGAVYDRLHAIRLARGEALLPAPLAELFRLAIKGSSREAVDEALLGQLVLIRLGP